MKIIFYLILTLLLNSYSIIPKWNLTTSVIDLLNGEDSHSYLIDNRNNVFGASDYLTKTIKKIGDKIIQENTFKMYDLGRTNLKFSGTVEFESIDSFYLDTNEKTEFPLVCPRGGYYPFKIISVSEMEEITSNEDWAKNKEFELKCILHRSEGGHFFAYFLRNEKNQLLELISSYYDEPIRFQFDFDEIYDFKLLNKKDFICNETNPYSFMALVKKDDNLRLIGTGFNFYSTSQEIHRYKDLLKIKNNTRAYFHVYQYNNDFYYFTYNDIYDFSSGYSTKSIPVPTKDDENPDYSDIADITFKNNERNPLEFFNDAVILKMEILLNNKYAYYIIMEKSTNKIYHGILDIKLNKIMFNTDEEIETFIPYITFKETSKGGYQHSNSMLMITKTSAYRVCAIKNGNDCVDECPSGTKLRLDINGNKCISTNNYGCEDGKLLLIPEGVCISKCDNLTIYVNNDTHCGLCRDMNKENKYRLIYTTRCLSEIPEGAVLSHPSLFLLVCDEGYQLQYDKCVKVCYTNCKTCYYNSSNPKNQQCKTCIEGYYLADNINYNCEPILPSTIPIIHTTIQIIPTTIPIIPTTFPNIPSTFLNIPTTIPNIPTTIPFIPTTIPFIPTTNIIIPSTTITITTVPEIIPTTLPIISSTVQEPIYINCTYQYYLTYNCSFENLNNSEILSKLKNEMLITYPNNGINVEIKASDGYAFQLSNSLNQLDFKYSSFSKINLKQCQTNIKEIYGLDPNISLIFIKYENIESSKNERKIHYEVYNPLNYEQLNISICQNSKIDLMISLELNNDFIKMIKNILEQEYNPFDEKGKFYTEKCTPYDSENGTDVLLDDRKEYIYNLIQSKMACPCGCEMISYSLDEKYINCECDINNSGIIGQDFNPTKTKNNNNNFLSTFKNSIFTVMGCYNLVFNIKIFFHNYISIITSILFIIYIIMLYFAIGGISPLILNFKKINEISINCTNTPKPERNKRHSTTRRHSRREKTSNPPKKRHSTTKRINKIDKEKNENSLRFIDIEDNNVQNLDTIPQNRDKKKFYSSRMIKRMTQDNNQINMYLKTKETLLNQKGVLEFKEEKESNSTPRKTKKENKAEIKENKIIKRQSKLYNYNDYKLFDDYVLNNMEYNDALEYDKRNCTKTYWSMLKREHYIIFTFYTKKDHNLFFIKFQRFLILICTEISMNGIFFVHETIYKKLNGDLNFAQKIPQIILALLISHIVEIFLCYLSMTDVTYYKLKSLAKLDKYNYQKLNDIIECMKIKLVAFFIFTFLIFLFNLYFISSFCAVYQNAKLIYLRDSAISIFISFIDPFIIYGIICLIRIRSLSKGKKKLICLYKTSHILPLF